MQQEQARAPLVPEDYPRGHFERLEQRSWHRAIAAAALGTARRRDPATILKGAWPQDARAELVLRAATSPLPVTGFPPLDTTAIFHSLAPGSAALALFERGLKIDLTGLNSVHSQTLELCPHRLRLSPKARQGPTFSSALMALLSVRRKKF